MTIGAMYGYALDYEPDFSVTLDAQNVQIDNCTGIDHNSIEIKDKCPHWCGLEDMLNMRYDNQIYYKIEGLPKGLICNFDPKAVNGIRDDPIIDINISATKCITSRVYSTKIVIYGADDKVKKCIMDIDVR